MADTDTSTEAVERLAEEYDQRVEQYSKLIDGPCGELRTERGAETAEVHKQTATVLRALAQRVAELEAERDAANAHHVAQIMSAFEVAG